MSTISRDEALNLFDEYLDDIYGDVEIVEVSFSTSEALKAVDEIIYNEMFNDWCDSYGYSETKNRDYIISDSIKVKSKKKLISESKKQSKFNTIFNKIIFEMNNNNIKDIENIEDDEDIEKNKLDEEKAYKLFDEYLNNSNSLIKIEDFTYYPSEVLKKTDSRTYRTLANKFFKDNNIEIWLE